MRAREKEVWQSSGAAACLHYWNLRLADCGCTAGDSVNPSKDGVIVGVRRATIPQKRENKYYKVINFDAYAICMHINVYDNILYQVYISLYISSITGDGNAGNCRQTTIISAWNSVRKLLTVEYKDNNCLSEYISSRLLILFEMYFIRTWIKHVLNLNIIFNRKQMITHYI